MKARVNFEKLNESLRPINGNTVKSIERNSARFIYVDRNGASKCERCNAEFTLANSKHKSFEVCPVCKKTLEVCHSWRRSSTQTIHWEVTGTALSSNIFVHRYYLVVRVDGKITESEERARLFMDFSTRKEAKFEQSIWDKGWRKGGRSFFRQYGMGYAENRLFCMGADIRAKFFDEVKKLDVFKYFDMEQVFEKGFYSSCIGFLSERIDLYEKLQKVGLNNLIKQDMICYSEYHMAKYDKTQTELSKMLGITKQSLNMLKTNPTLKALSIAQAYPSMSEKEFELLSRFDLYDVKALYELTNKIKATVTKISHYIYSQKNTVSNYCSYIKNLDKCGYNLKDEHYLFPRDFAKEMARVNQEIKDRESEFEAKKSLVIKAISDKIRSMPELQEFFNGSNGYLVTCPSSVEDFVNESKAQVNCVGKNNSNENSYASRFAREETLIFFVREINNPSASFVTMEYCHGVIVQCMHKHNKRVEKESVVYDFAQRLADRLNECNVLSA